MIAQYETNLTFRRQDENGDMMFGLPPGHSHAQSLEAMGMVIRSRLAAVENEWWEGDPGALPYYTDIIGGPGSAQNIDMIDLMIVERIMNTVGVIGVSDVVSSFKNRHYSFACKVKTIYGTTKAEVTT